MYIWMLPHAYFNWTIPCHFTKYRTKYWSSKGQSEVNFKGTETNLHQMTPGKADIPI